MPVAARFFAPVQTGSGIHSASYTMGTGLFPGVKRLGMVLTTQSHLAPRLKKEYSYTSIPPLGLYNGYRVFPGDKAAWAWR